MDKQIEEMARVIHKHFQYIKSDWEEYTKSDLALAYALKWNGYSKLPKDAVVLTKEGYDILIAVENERVQQARQETAEKIYKLADAIATGSQNDGVNIMCAIKQEFGL